jgi:hypothetical protein
MIARRFAVAFVLLVVPAIAAAQAPRGAEAAARAADGEALYKLRRVSRQRGRPHPEE